MFKLEPVVLTGKSVRLEPLQMEHAADLCQAAQDPTIWTYMPRLPMHSLSELEQMISDALQEQAQHVSLPFAIIDLSQQRAVGSTRYLDIKTQHRGLEIGWTWLTPSVQRTGINTECKYLLLRHAFEVWGAIRVQLKTHHLNFKSQ